MRGKLKLLVPVLLTVLLVVASAQNVFAAIEIAYDDDTLVAEAGNIYLGVRFTVPSGGSALLVQVRFCRRENYPVTVYVTQADHKTIIKSFPAPFVSGWGTYPVPGGGVMVPSEFYIILGGSPFATVFYDQAKNYDRSYGGNTFDALSLVSFGDFKIRAVVDTSSRVGGVVVPTNTLTVLASYVVVIGLVATIPVAYAVKRHRK